jgi:PEP-CTERM/exosortase A-associated glycosyltransferase
MDSPCLSGVADDTLRPVKILILSHMYPRPGREHYGVFVHESVLALRERGHEVLVVAPLPMTPPGLARLRPEWVRLAAIPEQRELDGVPLLHPRYLLLPRRIAFAGAAARMARAVAKVLPAWEFDLLHAHAGVPDGAAARRVAAELGIPYLVTSHGSDVLRASRWSPAIHAELHDAFRHARTTIFPSSRARQRARDVGLSEERGEVLWNGYREDLFTAPTPNSKQDEKPLRIICVANLVPSKGVDLLIEAMAAVEQPLELHLVGDGPERDSLLALADRLGVELRWDARLERRDLASALGDAHCFAMPAVGESFGIVYLEAMACGLPVIAPAGEGIADIVGHELEGLLLTERSAKALTGALDRLAGDRQLRARLASGARRRAAGLGWARHAAELERVYRDSLSAPSEKAQDRGKVFHLLYNSEPDRNGYAIRSRYILATQRELGWRPQASTGPFQQERWGLGPRESRDGLTYHRLELSGAYRKRGRLGWRRFWVFLQKALADRLLARRLARVLRRERPDLLHAHSPAFNLNLARRAARLAGMKQLPLIYEVRGLTEETSSLEGNTRAGGFLYRAKRRVEERAMARADAVVTLSEGMRKDFIARGLDERKLFVMPNGVDLEAIGLAQRDEHRAAELGLVFGKTLGFVGSMGRLEGLPWLIERLKELPPDWKLILVGDGQDREAILARAGELGLGDRIIAPGSLPHETVSRWYGLLDYVVLPRPSLRVTELVTPLKPLEAMAAGRIVLASDIGGHREIIEDGVNGFLFDRETPAAFLEQVTALAADAARRQALQLAAREWVERHRGWRRLVDGYRHAYEFAGRGKDV